LNKCWIRERKWCGVLRIEKIGVECCWKKKPLEMILEWLNITCNLENLNISFSWYLATSMAEGHHHSCHVLLHVAVATWTYLAFKKEVPSFKSLEKKCLTNISLIFFFF